jgi:diphthine methyl ester synthase
MSIPTAVSQVLDTESTRRENILNADSTLAIAVSRVGGDESQQRIVAGTLQELLDQPPEAFGEPLHSLVIVGKRVHYLEIEYAEMYAVNKESWRRVAKDVYGCADL